jgi:hypothetical protein
LQSTPESIHSSPPPVSYPNNSDTAGDFHWWNNGKYYVRSEKRVGKIVPGEQTFLKMYYACSQKKPTGCKATKTMHMLLAGEFLEFKWAHNHLPGSNPKTDPGVKQTVFGHLSVDAKPAAIHAKLVNEAQHPIMLKTMPTKQTIYNWQRKIVMSHLPTGMHDSFLLCVCGDVKSDVLTCR